MKKKKFSSIPKLPLILLSFFAAFILFPSVVSAVSLRVGSASVLVGDLVEVDVTISNAGGTLGGQFSLYYMPEVEGNPYSIEIVSVNSGDFFNAPAQSSFQSRYEHGLVNVSWTTPDGDTADRGVLARLTFRAIAAGTSDMVFGLDSEVEISQIGTVDINDLRAGSIYVFGLDPERGAAVRAAVEAIEALPPAAGISLSDKPAVEEARRLVERAKRQHGADDADFHNLDDKLVPAENRIRELEAAGQEPPASDREPAPARPGGSQTEQKRQAVNRANEAIAKIPPVERLVLADKSNVESARDLVERAKSDHGAGDADFKDLDILAAAEEKIKQLEEEGGEEARKEAISEAVMAIATLPALKDLTLDDEEQVKYARFLVDKAKFEHGAADEDIPNLDLLIAAEEEIRLLLEEGEGGSFSVRLYLLPAVLVLLAAAVVVLVITILKGTKKKKTI